MGMGKGHFETSTVVMIAQELSQQQETPYEENRDNYKQPSQLLAAALRTHPQHE